MAKETKREVAKPNESVPSKTEAFVATLVNSKRAGFLAANAGLDLDFVYFTKWLSINSKGQFVEKVGEGTGQVFGDEIDVIIAKGEQKFSLWGKEDSPEDGELIVAENTREEAERRLEMWLEENPNAAERYSLNDIQSRYIAYVCPIKTLTKEDADLFTIGFSPTSKMAFGQWAFSIYNGNPAEIAKGIPAGTSVNRVVVRIKTEAKVNKQKQNYIVLAFESIELFDPSKL